MSDIHSILFVCTGNSCRSVMAEGLMKRYLKEAGKEYIRVDSAGVSAPDSLPPTIQTIELMDREGIDVSDIRSKRLNERLIKQADLILTMEDMHKFYIKRTYPEVASRVFMLKEYLLDEGGRYPEEPNVPDPIGRPMGFYKLSFQIIKDQLKRIIKKI